MINQYYHNTAAILINKVPLLLELEKTLSDEDGNEH